MVLFGIWWSESLCPEEVPSGCVPCITLQEAAYLLVLWLVPKSLNYIGLDPFMNWGQSTTVFPGNEFLFLVVRERFLNVTVALRALERVQFQLVNLVKREFIETVLGFILAL